MIHVGFGRTDITPPLGTICSLGVDDNALAIFDPVYARATVLGQGAEAIAILSLDVIGLYRPEMNDLRNCISERTGVNRERIVLHTTHTHESPSTERSFTEIVKPFGLEWHTEAFFQLLLDQSARAVQLALEDSHPAELSFGFYPVAEIASYRRIRPLGGATVLRNSRSTAEYRLYPEGWIDPYVRVAIFTDPATQREHWLLNYSCHPTVAGGDEGPYITGDFPGNAMARIEYRRPNVTCNYFTGCCGNINPGKYTGSSNEPADRVADVLRLGGQLADAVLAARDQNTRPLGTSGLAWTRHSIKLDVLPKIRDRATLEHQLEQYATAYAQRRAKGERVAGGGTDLFWTVYNLFAARSADEMGKLETDVMAARVGELGILFLPAECFLEIDDAIRDHFPDKPLL